MNEQGLNIPRIMIAGTHSGVGKTTITTAVMAALTGAGYKVQPYKVGPDYIDPSYHTLVTGRKSRNLDSWMVPEDSLLSLFSRAATDSDLSVIEGVMGLFDGSSATTDHGSSAQIAKLLDCPVVLIIDVRSMARSAAAIALGFKNFDPALNIAGIIVNRVGSDRHLSLVREAIEAHCDIPVVGYIRKNAKLELPSRHLGLIPTVEGGTLAGTVHALAEEIKEGIDIDGIIKLARSAPAISKKCTEEQVYRQLMYHSRPGNGKIRIGIASDEAFSFYYRDGLDVLESAGAELVPFSPLHDNLLPGGIDGIYIGGGFPEMYIRDLSDNYSLGEEIKNLGLTGMPVFAECGGLMYLARAIVDFDGREYPMTGLVPGTCIMEKSLVGMGYVEAESLSDNLLTCTGGKVKGHEFHYSRLQPDDEEFPYAFRLVRNRYRSTVFDGYANGNILASYLHMHFASDPKMAERFVAKCREYRENKNNC